MENNTENLKNLYERMLTIRRFEERVSILYSNSKIPEYLIIKI